MSGQRLADGEIRGIVIVNIINMEVLLMRTISLKCKDCNGTLDISEDQEIIFCPYCGSKNLIVESDEVKIERIREENKRQMEQDRIDQEERNDQRFLRITIGFLIVIVIGLIILLK